MCEEPDGATTSGPFQILGLPGIEPTFTNDQLGTISFEEIGTYQANRGKVNIHKHCGCLNAQWDSTSEVSAW